MSNTSNVVYLGELRTEATHVRSGKVFINDAPPDNNGRGEAFSPTDTTATSLATCMMTLIGIAANTRNIEIKGMHATVKKVMAENPRRISEVHVDLHLNIPRLDENNKRVLEHAGRNCPVAKSLHPDIRQEITFTYE